MSRGLPIEAGCLAIVLAGRRPNPGVDGKIVRVVSLHSIWPTRMWLCHSDIPLPLNRGPTLSCEGLCSEKQLRRIDGPEPGRDETTELERPTPRKVIA
jgi:hypothetical protein